MDSNPSLPLALSGSYKRVDSWYHIDKLENVILRLSPRRVDAAYRQLVGFGYPVKSFRREDEDDRNKKNENECPCSIKW